MANHSHDTEAVSDAMDYAQHEGTWKVFTQMVKWGIIGCAVLVVALYFIINP